MTIQQDTQEQDPVPQEETENISSPIPGDENTSDDATGQQQDSSADEIIRLQAALARSQADYQNLLMRVERDRADMVHFLSAKILAPLLTQVDNLERAIAIKDGIEGDAFIDGVRALHTGLLRYLENQGVRPFDSV